MLPTLLVVILTASSLSAQEGKTKKNADPKVLRLHLMEGSVVSVRLTVDTITVATEFGTLEIQVAKIVSFTPGLESHLAERKRISSLILQLGAKSAKLRDQAEKELAGMGLAVKEILKTFADDKDPERKTRIGRLLQQMEQLQEEADEEGKPIPAALIAEDTVQTPNFTVVGKISPEVFKVQTKFGVLTVALSDIRRAEKEVEATPEIRRTISVAGRNLVVVNYKRSSIRVKRGDRVTITASGSVTLPPWGNQARSGPDGAANYGQYKTGMPVGALVGKIGASGAEFKAGSSHKFTATRSGELYFAIAMRSNYLRGNYNFSGEYKVKIRVIPGDASKLPSRGTSPRAGGKRADVPRDDPLAPDRVPSKR